MSTPTTVSEIVFSSTPEYLKVLNILNGPLTFPRNGITGVVLHGVPGTGKTELAKILPGAIDMSRPNGVPNPYVQTFNCASSNNGVALLKIIEESLRYFPVGPGSGLHYIVLDEADSLTPIALTHLKSLMDMRECVFILTTNNIGAFQPALLNRCVQVSFNPTDPKIWLPRLNKLLHAKGITNYTNAFLESVVVKAEFSARQIMSQLSL